MADKLEDLLIATYKPLFESERTRRDQIRASLAVPVAAMSIAMVGFGVLLNNFQWHDGTVLALIISGAIVALALVAVGCLVSALTLIIKADKPEVREDPPALSEIQRFSRERRQELSQFEEQVGKEIVLKEVKKSLAGDYYSCYTYMIKINADILGLRDLALKRLGCALVSLLLAFLGTGFDKGYAVLTGSVQEAKRVDILENKDLPAVGNSVNTPTAPQLTKSNGKGGVDGNECAIGP